jgi:Zn-dependent peptidase ImmA (M78 family)
MPAIDLEFERLETAADRFAAELLMPAKAIRRVFVELFGKTPLIPEEAEGFLVCGPTRDRFEISRGLSRYPIDGTRRSLCSTFGVSQSAAGRRILELELLA